MSPRPRDPRRRAHRLKTADLRRRCDPARFEFRTTTELGDCPINIIGQERAQEALRLGLAVRSEGYNIFVTGDVGGGRSTSVRRMLSEIDLGKARPDDVVYVHNFRDNDQPLRLQFQAGVGRRFRAAVGALLQGLGSDLPHLFDSDEYRQRRAAMIDAAGRQQRERLKEFERHVQEQGFALVQVQIGPLTRPSLVPLIDGNPTEIEQLEQQAEKGQFPAERLESLRELLTRLRGEMESLGKQFRALDRQARHDLAELDRSLARPLIEEAVGDLRQSIEAEGLEDWLQQVTEDLLSHLEAFHEEAQEEQREKGGPEEEDGFDRTDYSVNVLVDNAKTCGRPVIWETAPTYRNLFGTIEKVRTVSGEWETDHMRIKAGSLLRANQGYLVLDALDVLVEPGVWAALKRTLRTGRVEIQSFDPVHHVSAISLKPQPSPIDVKVLMIGTRQIYRVLHALDEDFEKIFKVKADMAMHTPFSDEELMNYACFVQKKVRDDDLLPFHRTAVATVVEHGMRLAEDQNKLTTRFNEIADLIRESSYWAKEDGARWVRVEHVDRALDRRAYRVSLVEELLRERIAEGQVLLDLEGTAIGQVNGLVLLDQGDHVFGQPTRITATTAMGRAGIIDLDREAELSGSIHTKGVLILTGFLRERFAQDKPLTLTATLCFEQSYANVDGDSASSAELYALLSSLSEVPIRQGIAVTGSVNQRGEVQPIGGVNEKIEGYYDLCRLTGLSGEQGVMIPRTNVRQLMLRKDLVSAVRQGRFQIWAVSTIEEGLEVLTGQSAGLRGDHGAYAADTILGRAEGKLRTLAEQVSAFGVADGGHPG